MSVKPRRKGNPPATALMVAAVLAGTGCSDAGSPSEARSGELAGAGTRAASVTSAPRKIAVLDDCRASDPWPGGCALEGGSVSLAEFQADAPRGHAAWRNEPSYLKFAGSKDVKIVNFGGRTHSFTEVAAYGNGLVPPLNLPGVAVAPECLNGATFGPTLLPPGESLRIEGLAHGTHKFMCCFHPWMVAEIRVE